MSEVNYKAGNVLENSVGQFAKIISIVDGRYNLSGWTNKVSAMKATVANMSLNIFGIEALNAKIVKGSSEKTSDSASNANNGSTDAKPTKSAINALNAQATKELAVKLGIAVAEADTKAMVTPKILAHYGL